MPREVRNAYTQEEKELVASCIVNGKVITKFVREASVKMNRTYAGVHSKAVEMVRQSRKPQQSTEITAKVAELTPTKVRMPWKAVEIDWKAKFLEFTL